MFSSRADRDVWDPLQDKGDPATFMAGSLPSRREPVFHGYTAPILAGTQA